MKQYELLEKQAAMMRLAEKYGINDWRDLVLVCGNECTSCFEILSSQLNQELGYWSNHEFALSVIEGKPVFVGDELYWRGEKQVINKYGMTQSEFWSWNPPAPKTGMIELPIADIEAYALHLKPIIGSDCADGRLAAACQKTLDSIKN